MMKGAPRDSTRRAVCDWMDWSAKEAEPVVRSLRRPEPHREKASILRYLREGYVVLGGPHRVPDMIDASRPGLAEFYVLTDGRWEWTTAVTYHFDHDDIELHRDFLDHMRRNRWEVPGSPR